MQIKQPKTYFFLNWKLNKKIKRYGPYSDLHEAINVMVCDLPDIAHSQSKKKTYSFEAKIQEEYLCKKDKDWCVIATPVTENSCLKL